MLKIRSLEAGYDKLRVIKNLSLHVDAGEIVAIIGGNGAGKSTLLASIAGLVKKTAGSVAFRDEDVSALPPEKIARKGLALVPEGRQLFPDLSVEENLTLGAFPFFTTRRGDEARKAIKGAYELFPRLEERRKQLAGTLSGGEQQMLAIGRALAASPDFIMLDEPSMGLAPLVVRDIFRVIQSLKDRGKTILLIEQNAKAALGIADRGYVMETGSLILEGASCDLLENRDVQRAYLGKEYKSIAD